jgi:uncharacterized protein (TIGR02246 family)
MMTMKTLITVSFVAAAMIASPAFAGKGKKSAMACAPVTAAAVESQFDAFNAAWATKDPTKVTSLFTRDAVLLATVSNKPRTTTAGVQDYFVNFLKGSPVGTINTSTISLGCNTAMRLGTWTVTLTNAETGAKTDVKARYSFIYKLEDGQWKIYHLHSSMMPEPAA